jgi:hypothetical protein
MASKVVIRLEDDVDGSEATETVHFALEGVEYEIDLSEQNAAKLRDSVAGYVEKARKVRGRGRRSGDGGVKRDQLQTKAIRAWAQSHGHDVSGRGRIPASVVEAYDAAR